MNIKIVILLLSVISPAFALLANAQSLNLQATPTTVPYAGSTVLNWTSTGMNAGCYV